MNRNLFIKIQTFFVLFLLNFSFVNAQIVVIDPTFFNGDSDITVTFDATQGNGGLEGESQVFMHAGLITDTGGAGSWQNVQGNWGTFDPNVLMTNIGVNKHQKSYNIKDFHNFTSTNSTIVQLAFVFRNLDGSKVGKTAAGGDIFVDVPDVTGFDAFFVTPTSQQIVKQVGESIEVKIVSSEAATITLFDNNQSVTSAANVEELEFTLPVSTQGNHVVHFEVNNANGILRDTFSYVGLDGTTVVQADPPAGTKFGLNRISDSESILALYAPMKDHVFAFGSFNDWLIDVNYLMKRSLDGNTWWLELDNLDPNTFYLYQYLIDGSIKIADPYSELILDKDNDGGIPASLQSIPADYPTTQTEGHVSVFKTVTDNFNWQVTNFQAPQKKDLVIYEILMRDFLADHAYESLIDTLNYLQDLGVNVIELMPVSEFENNDSWGYNPSYHMALDKYYGSVESFKKVVDAAHSRGIAIILDVVYNHAFGQSPLVRMYWDAQNNKPSAESPYFNVDPKHPFNVGFDFNHESEATQTYVKQTLDYWMSEYKIDGFRFDLSKGFTQTFSTNDGVFASYDSGRIATLKDYGDHLWDQDADQLLILEHFATNSEEKELAEYGFMLWANANHTFNEATMGYHDSNKSDFKFLYFENKNWDVPHNVGYMESHDEERLMYKNLQYGNSGSNYSIPNIVTGLERNAMASTFFFAIPGPKMVWQFGELGYEFSINRCENGTISPDCRLSRKPIRWDYLDNDLRVNLNTVYSKMITLKKSHPAVRDGQANLKVNPALKKMHLNHADGNICIIGNFGVEEATIDPEFQHTGTWINYLSGDEYIVNDVNGDIVLAPGEYYVYVDNMDFTALKDVENFENEISIYPNPAHSFVNVTTTSEVLFNENFQLNIFDATGRLIKNEKIQFPFEVDFSNQNSGMYFIQLIDDSNQLITKKVVLQK